MYEEKAVAQVQEEKLRSERLTTRPFCGPQLKHISWVY
jgi:hypothetical protein